MSLEASTLQVIVKGDGITATTDALNKLATAGDKAEKSTTKLAKAGKTADAAAQAQAKVWYDLVDKVSKAKEREYNALQRHNNRVYANIQAEANKLNKLYDRQIAQDAANFAKRRAQEQSQLEALDTMRHRAAAKEYARAQAEATRMNALLDRQRKQAEAAAKASAERQRVLNSNYSAASLAQQISTLQRAQQYGAQGGNISQRFGSQVAGASSSGELERLQRQYRQLQLEASRANRTMTDTHAAVRGLSGSLGALWMTYGALMPLLAGAAVGAAIKGVVDVGTDIEHTLEKIRVLGQSTTGEIDEMRKVILDLGQGVQGPRDVAEALSVLTLAGLKAADAMKAVKGTLNLAIAGDVGIEKAASTIVQIRTSLGYTADDFDHIADVVAKTAAVSMSSVDSISGAFLSAAAVGEVYGASLQDIATGLAAVANLGIQGTAAGTTLKNFYADLAKGSEKSTQTLKALGLTLRDLKDENGAFINTLDLITKIDRGMYKLSKQARPEAMDKLFGERGVKTGAAFLKMVNEVSTEIDHLTGKTYDNKLAEVFGEIEKSAAFATTAAIAMGQTTQNQLKSVGNTLQTSLASAFSAVAPQIGEVARRLKAAFASKEFIDGIKFITTSIANLTLFIVEHSKQIGIMIAAYAGWKIGVFVAGLVSMAKNFNIAAIAARGFTAALGPLGLAIVALGAAWELYANQKNKAITDNDANANSLDEYAKELEEAAIREREALKMRLAGVSESDVARKEQIARDKAASDALVKQSADGVMAMKATMQEQWNALSENQKKRAKLFLEGKVSTVDRMGTKQFIEQYRAVTEAANKHNRVVESIQKNQKSLFEDRSQNAKLADEAAKKMWSSKGFGTGELADPAAEKSLEKMAKFIQNEALELKKSTASYEAKNEAMREAIRLGQHMMADTKQAIVLENLKAGKYGANKTESNEIYQAQKKLALADDMAKAENERLKKQNEFSNKLAELEAAQSEYNAAAIDGSLTHFGALRKEAEGIIRINSLTNETADSLRKRADAADAFRKSQEAIVKINSATDSSNQRAEQAREEAEMMLQYGESAKVSAMQVAELTIQKLKLDAATSKNAIAALREAAATEQLNTAYRELAKSSVDLSKQIEDAQAESLVIFSDSEAKKVSIANETRKKLLAIEYQKAQDAFDAKGNKSFEDFEAMAGVYNTYLANVAKSDELATLSINNLKLKEWKKTVDNIEQIGREGFYNLTEKGVSLWSSMARTFKSMFKTTVMDYIYKEFAKPIVLKVVASLAGAVGADGLANAANAMGGGGHSSGILGAVSTVKNLYSAMTGGLSALGTNIASTIGQGLSYVGNAVGSNAMFSFGQGMQGFSAGGMGSGISGGAASAGSTTASALGTAAGYLGGALGGHYLGRTISGGYAVNGSGNGMVNTGTAIGAVVGGPIGALVGGAIAGGINRLFGMKQKEITKTGISGAIEADGKVSGQAYSEWYQKGGVFRSDKSGVDNNPLDTAIVNSFAAGMNELKFASTEFAKSLGVSTDALIGYGKHFNIELTEDANANQEAISKFFTEISDDMATKLVPNIMEFAKQGETAGVVLERLSKTFAVTKDLADVFGKSVAQVFGADGMASAAARTKFVDLSGRPAF